MRCVVLVDSDASNVGGAGPQPEHAQLRELMETLGFELVPTLDDVTAGDTVLLHARGSLRDGLWLRELTANLAKRNPESALVMAEVTHDQPHADALVAAEVVEAVRGAIDPVGHRVAAIVAVRAKSLDVDSIAFTRIVVRAADSAVDGNGCTMLSALAARLRTDAGRHEAAQSYAVTNVDGDFAIARTDRPSMPSLIALADGARDRAEWVHARAGYRAALMAARDAESRAQAWSRLGAMERARCDEPEAMRAYEKAVAAQPNDRAAIDALAELAKEAGDAKRAVLWASRRAALLEPSSEKVDELFAIARTYVQELGDLPSAIAALEGARAIDAREDVLEALRRAYRKMSEWPKLLEITGVLADNAPSAEERAARRFAQARIALDRMNDPVRAGAFLALALDDDPTHDEALDVLIEIRTSLGEAPSLRRALEGLRERLEAMGELDRARDVQTRIAALPVLEVAIPVAVEEDVPVATVDADSTGPLETLPDDDLDLIPDDEDEDGSAPITLSAPQPVAAVPMPEVFAAEPTPEVLAAPPAPEIFVAPLGPVPPAPDSIPPVLDATQPYEALVAGAVLGREEKNAPKASHDRTSLVEELLAAGDEGGALEELEAAVARSPLDVALHERLFALHSRAERFDRALLSAMVLEEIAGASLERDTWLDHARSPGALRLRALLDSTAWELLRTDGSDDVIESLFAAISKAAVLAQVDERRARRKLPSIDPARKQSEDSTVSIMASFRWAARALGVECPNLYVLDDVPGDVAAVPAAEPSTVIGPSVLTGLSTKELAFIVARHLTYYRPEHAVLLYFPTIQDLTLLVLAAVQLAMPAMPVPPTVAAQVASLRERISDHISDADRAKMAAAVDRLEGRGGRLELGPWVKSVEMTATRVGLVLCGDLRAAMSRIRSESRATSCVTVDEARADLVAFCGSRAHADIRAEYALVATSWPPSQASGVRSRDDYATPTWNLMGDRAI
jgi:tetratricopeptide (TPR) repeat protein